MKTKRTKRKVAVHWPDFPVKKVVLKAKWQLPWTDYARLRWGKYPLDFLGITQTCAAGKRLFRAFGTEPKRLRITIEEV